MLNIEKNFFNTIFNKIQSTKAKEQMTNISKFANILLGNLIVILERDNNEILQKIDSTLEIDTVKQYFKENQFDQTVIMQFKKKIKEKYDRDINKDDYKTFVSFFQ